LDGGVMEGCGHEKTKGKIAENDGDDDGRDWSRFERAVDAAVKSGPMHKTQNPTESANEMKDAKNADGSPAAAFAMCRELLETVLKQSYLPREFTEKDEKGREPNIPLGGPDGRVERAGRPAGFS
jgi:hypothetical protein